MSSYHLPTSHHRHISSYLNTCPPYWLPSLLASSPLPSSPFFEVIYLMPLVYFGQKFCLYLLAQVLFAAMICYRFCCSGGLALCQSREVHKFFTFFLSSSLFCTIWCLFNFNSNLVKLKCIKINYDYAILVYLNSFVLKS